MTGTFLQVRSRADFMRVALRERRSKDEKSLVKIVHTNDGDFLSEWSFDDIKREPYGIISKRPMVFMLDAHEAIEKSMWCYERAMVPLIGELDLDIAVYTAEKYQIDQLIADAESCIKLVSYLRSRAEPLLAISILDASFDPASLLPLAPFAKQVRLVLTLPETGVIAEAPLSKAPVFSVAPDCKIDAGGSLVVTKLLPLVTPITGYDTGIRIAVQSKLADGSVESFVLSDN
ncbi:hypothetical protein HY971_02050 [Candidatus Kaiserbacteria bacterium]|nr:hypothetical protein [Candidatus Kaiserbacteria bacterium]